VRRGIVTLLLALLASGANAQERTFAVYLDGKRIGTHRFEIVPDGDDALRVTSQAAFDVKVLGIPVFRYRHSAVEHWRAGCLSSIETTTVVNGERSALTGRPSADGFSVEVRDANGERRESLPACIASFAYWDRDTLARHRALLNGQTGAYQTVEQTAVVDPRSTEVVLQGPDFRIDLGYAGPDGGWRSLATSTHEGRRLEYRLESAH